MTGNSVALGKEEKPHGLDHLERIVEMIAVTNHKSPNGTSHKTPPGQTAVTSHSHVAGQTTNHEMAPTAVTNHKSNEDFDPVLLSPSLTKVIPLSFPNAVTDRSHVNFNDELSGFETHFLIGGTLANSRAGIKPAVSKSVSNGLLV